MSLLAAYGQLSFYAYLAITLLIVGAAAFALVHALRAPAQAFTAAGKWQKNYWAITLIGCALLALAGLGGMGLVIGAVGVLVYLLDVRPKLDEVRRPRY
ncbi:hypothetical protein GCM10027289_13040 [Tsukamurella serpentis]